MICLVIELAIKLQKLQETYHKILRRQLKVIQKYLENEVSLKATESD